METVSGVTYEQFQSFATGTNFSVGILVGVLLALIFWNVAKGMS